MGQRRQDIPHKPTWGDFSLGGHKPVFGLALSEVELGGWPGESVGQGPEGNELYSFNPAPPPTPGPEGSLLTHLRVQGYTVMKWQSLGGNPAQ